MLILPAVPAATIAEVEIGLPELAARYSAAIGEPVDVLPAVERRAVAIFARNEPWERVLALAGESAGFRLARKADRLRFEPTRPLSQASLERSLGDRILKLLDPPEDVAGAGERQRAARAEMRALMRRADTPAAYRRLRELREIVYAGTVVNSAETLALARYLRRGGGLTLGESVAFSGAGALNADEYGLFAAGTTAEGSSVATFRVAARVTLRAVDLASVVRSRKGELVRRSERIAIDPPNDAATTTVLRDHPLDPERRPVPRFVFDGWAIGDYLRWLHASDGRPCAAPALRIALEGPDDRGFESILDRGYRLVERDGAVAATSEFGEGFWPRDFRDLDALKSPDVRGYARFATTLKPPARAATLDSLPFLGVHPLVALRSGGSFLRFFAALPHDLGSHLLDGGEIAGTELPLVAARALRASMAEEDGPIAALAPASDAAPLAASMRPRREKIRSLFLDTGQSVEMPRELPIDGVRIEYAGRTLWPVEQQDSVRETYDVAFGRAEARHFRTFSLLRREGARTPLAPR